MALYAYGNLSTFKTVMPVLCHHLLMFSKQVGVCGIYFQSSVRNVNKFFGIGSVWNFTKYSVQWFGIKIRLPHLGNKHGEVHVVVL